MQVNYIQIAYVLGITPLKAKLMMKPYIERFNQSNKGQKNKVKPISPDDYIDSSLLRIIFHHPSTELDGKDKIAYIIEKLQNGIDIGLKKKIVEELSCLKAGKIAGKYRPLLYILSNKDIEEINTLIRKRREIFIKSGGSFPRKKNMRGL